MKFRIKKLASGVKLILGKDEKSNDELMRDFEGKENTILHTSNPGSPFGVIDTKNPSEKDLHLSGAFVVRYSQSWRENKEDTLVDVFKGKDISKPKRYKPGSWKVKKKNTIKIKKEEVKKIENGNI